MLSLQYDQEAEHKIIRQEGIEEGREEERAKAETEKFEEKIEMAKEMLRDGNELEMISKYTKLSLSDLEELKSEI